MTPAEIYSLPDMSCRYWYEGHNAMVEKALDFQGWGHGEAYILNSDTDRLAVFEKIRSGPQDRPSLAVYALAIDANDPGHPPFAVILVREGDLSTQETIVTNYSLWQKAREHVIVTVNKNIKTPGGIAKSDDQIASLSSYGISGPGSAVELAPPLEPVDGPTNDVLNDYGGIGPEDFARLIQADNDERYGEILRTAKWEPVGEALW